MVDTANSVDYLRQIGWFMTEMADLVRRCEQELEDLQSYLDGERRSNQPLGSIFLLSRGIELQALQDELAARMKGQVQ